MNRPKLSLLVPVIPGRIERLRAILQRVSLSIRLYNRKFVDDKLSLAEDVEFVIVDGGDTAPVKELCKVIGQHHIMKYVYVPIKRFINAGYPRNVGLRMCEGDVIGHLDVDHFPSEFVVEGMLRPFLDKKIDRHINRGYVIDSSKSRHSDYKGNYQWLESLNRFVLSPTNLKCHIAELYEKAAIPPPGCNNTLWVWAAKREYVDQLNGYDEVYCRRFAYCREDDDWRERMLANGMPFWDGANKEFCGIHLWHPAPHRTDQANNEINKQYFKKVCQPVHSVRRNDDWEWGKLLDGSFSMIWRSKNEGEYREPTEHEQWIAENRPEVKPYDVDSPSWGDIDDYLNKLEEYVS